MGFILSIIVSPLVRQMFRFAAVGASTTVIDYGVFIGLTRGTEYFAIHFLMANAIAFVFDTIWNFSLNRKYTFRHNTPGIGFQYASFLGVAGVGLLWNTLLLAAFVRNFGVYDLVAKAFAIVIVFFWNFSMQKIVTFHFVPRLVSRRENT